MKASVRFLYIVLLLAVAAGGLFAVGPTEALPAAFSSETAVYQPPEPAPLKSFAPSLRQEDEPSPAPLTETAAAEPLCVLRREVTVDTSYGGSVTLPEGASCYLEEAWADGNYHLLRNELGTFYVSCFDVDASACGVVYEFYEDQDMRIPTCFSGEELERCLSGGLSGLGQAFADAEARYGVNALFMIAICQHESGNGESGLATSQNNLIGLRSGGGWASFGSMTECVDYLGDYLANYYLSPGCPFYHGSTVSGVSVTYCNGNPDWIRHIYNYMRQDLAYIRY
ncbi:MAG: glucosaminidase domain-containing protein [Firmicutes bacterium]|nr:glucosaminidase domain-containing protein [Bacillota bacterium]